MFCNNRVFRLVARPVSSKTDPDEGSRELDRLALLKADVEHIVPRGGWIVWEVQSSDRSERRQRSPHF
jgi:hypothetical protein